MKNRNYAVDVTKFIMSIMVIALHVEPFDGMGEEINFFFTNVLTRICVPMYFCIAGYFLFQKAQEKGMQKEILGKYVFRVMKLYLLWTILYIPIIRETYLSENTQEMRKEYYYRFFCVGSYRHLWYLYALAVAVVLVWVGVKFLSPTVTFVLAGVLYLLGLLGDTYYGVLEGLSSFRNPWLQGYIENYYEYFATTRNGLFFGCFFVALGMMFAREKSSRTIPQALIGVVVSVAGLALEMFYIRDAQLAYSKHAYNAAIFLLPTTFFLFHLIMNLSLKERKIYPILCKSSTIIYCAHFAPYYYVKEYLPVSSGGGRFVIVCLITIPIAIAVAWASTNIHRCRVLKHLY